jgi:thiol-disulfide isomerase/thioredoxin
MKKNLKNAYLTAFLISIFIFISGIVVGYFVQKSVSERTEDKISKLQNRIEDIQLQYMYLSMIDENDCEFGAILFNDATNELWEISRELSSFGNRISKEELNRLEKKYFLLSAKAWVLNSYITKNCEEEALAILYFYSVPCDDCENQGEILDSVQNSDFKEKIRVFVMNTNLEEKMVQTLTKAYNITSTPTIIVDGEKYEGLLEETRIVEILSKKLNNS